MVNVACGNVISVEMVFYSKIKKFRASSHLPTIHIKIIIRLTLFNAACYNTHKNAAVIIFSSYMHFIDF